MKRVAALFMLLAASPAFGEEIGECRFDRDTLTFAGTRVEQASCLLRKIELLAVRREQPLPAVIRQLMESEGAPEAGHKAAAIAAFPEPYRSFAIEHAEAPVSRTEAGLPALYFVIHDTSTPFYADTPFPRHLDNDPEVNSFEPYLAGGIAEAPVAHIFLSRQGQIWGGHDFVEGWRATKLESRVIGPAARGRFIHIETMQPRRFLPGATSRGQTQGPRPGFTQTQYRMLAALYVYASARAGYWLIPAQHNTVDAGIPDAHDDPQNFELEGFARELAALVSPPQRPR